MRPGAPHRRIGLKVVAGATAAAASLVATACCVGTVIPPLLVSVIGVSGAAWVGGLKPVAPYLVTGAFALLAYTFMSIRRRARSCRAGEAPRAAARVLLVVASGVWLSSAILLLIQRLGPA
jgi:hypothetical protein